MTATRYATRQDANEAIRALRMGRRHGKPGITHFAQANLENGVEYYLIAELDAPLVGKGRPVRSERHIYTPSGKKLTNRAVCGRLFKQFSADRAAFIEAAVKAGVRRVTANAMFSHHSVGRYAKAA